MLIHDPMVGMGNVLMVLEWSLGHSWALTRDGTSLPSRVIETRGVLGLGIKVE